MRFQLAIFLGLFALGCGESSKTPDTGTAGEDPITYTDCEPGSYVSVAATDTADRTCTECTAGVDYSVETNADSCTPVTDCDAGSYISTEGTTTSDQACTECTAGTDYSSDINADACTPVSDCDAGTYVSAEATTTSDQTCTDCTAGIDYSTDINADSCIPVSDCAEGGYTSEEATVTSDLTCAECTGISHCASGLSCTTDSDSTCGECDEGYDLSEDAMTCDEVSGGHVVLIGHDYFENEDNADLILGNAVLLADTADTIQIVAYTEYADIAGEYDNMLDALTWTVDSDWEVTELSDEADLDLTGAHVLLIPEQESAGFGGTELADVGTAWNAALSAFVDSGGVVIACDFRGSLGGTWETIAGLFATPPTGATNVTDDTLDVADPSSPLADGVSAYEAINGSLSFTGEPSGNAVITAPDGSPVVLHIER